MEDKFKFRAKIELGEEIEMFYQENQYLSSFLRRIYTKYGVEHPSYLNFDIEDILMQCTGIKDKNGKLIYEGDIINISGYGIYEAKFPFLELYDIDDSSDIEEILGNKFENPELLN